MSELVLGIDTATSVAVGLANEDQVLASALVGDSRSHVELLVPTIAKLCAQAGCDLAQVTRIGVGVGPGPFTGLRVGIATAQTLAQALDVPVVGVCSLDVIAIAATWRTGSPMAPGADFLVVLDARRHEVYWARYDYTGLRVDGPFVGAPTGLPLLRAIGPGLAQYPQLAGQGDVDDCPMDAGVLAAHLDALPEVGLEPLYLRQPDAEMPSTRKSAIVGGRLRLPQAVV